MKFFLGYIVYADETRSKRLALFDHSYREAYSRLALLALEKRAVSAVVTEHPLSDAHQMGVGEMPPGNILEIDAPHLH